METIKGKGAEAGQGAGSYLQLHRQPGGWKDGRGRQPATQELHYKVGTNYRGQGLDYRGNNKVLTIIRGQHIGRPICVGH